MYGCGYTGTRLDAAGIPSYNQYQNLKFCLRFALIPQTPGFDQRYYTQYLFQTAPLIHQQYSMQENNNCEKQEWCNLPAGVCGWKTTLIKGIFYYQLLPAQFITQPAY